MASRRDFLLGAAVGAGALSIWPLSPALRPGRPRSIQRRAVWGSTISTRGLCEPPSLMIGVSDECPASRVSRTLEHVKRDCTARRLDQPRKVSAIQLIKGALYR